MYDIKKRATMCCTILNPPKCRFAKRAKMRVYKIAPTHKLIDLSNNLLAVFFSCPINRSVRKYIKLQESAKKGVLSP